MKKDDSKNTKGASQSKDLKRLMDEARNAMAKMGLASDIVKKEIKAYRSVKLNS